MSEPRGPVRADYDHHGDRVYWQVEGDGPPVVLCHGTPWSSALWEPLATELARRWRVYRWDMLGYGQSTKEPNQDVSIAAQGELLDALLHHWNLDAPRIVAHDIGGAVALRTHLLHQHTYRSLTLVDPVALTPWGSGFFRLVQENTEVFQQLPADLHGALVRAYIRGASHRPLSTGELEELSSPWVGAEGQSAFYRQMAQADQRDTDQIEPLYPTLRIPTQLIWGAEDPWIPIDRAHRLAAVIPGARLTVIEHAGHLLQLEAPKELAASVSDFLTAHRHPLPVTSRSGDASLVEGAMPHMPDPVTGTPAAEPHQAVAHYSSLLGLETDCWDVHEAMERHAPGFVLLDVRSPDAYDAGHVPGAINLPHGRIVERTIDELPSTELYVVYCAGPHCNGADRAALKLAQLDLPVKKMIGGITGWLDEGFDLVR